MLAENGRAIAIASPALAATLLGAAALLAACSGSTGSQGPAGPAGATGPAGPAGPSSTVSALDIATASAITATISKVTVPSSAPIQPVVSFQLVNQDGEPLKGLTANEISFAIAKLVPPGTQLAPLPPQTAAPAPLQGAQWQSYLYSSASPAAASAGNTTTPVVGTAAVPQAATEAGSAGKLVDNGDGTYQYTFAKDISSDPAVNYDATLTHRVGFEIRGATDPSGNAIVVTNPVYTFQPSTGATTNITAREIVDDTDCKACHQVISWHGGGRTEIKYCVLCHNPSSFEPSSGNSIDFKVMFHKIHMGSSLPSVLGTAMPAAMGGAAPAAAAHYYIFGHGSIDDYSDVQFPRSDASNNNTTVSGNGTRLCTTCHNTHDQATPQAGNYASIPSAQACGSCHDNANFATGAGHGPSNLPAADDQCITCHGPASTIDNGGLQVAAVHSTPVDAAIQKFQYQVVSVTSTGAGQTPVATILVSDPANSNAPYDITDAAGPFQNANSSLNIDLAYNTIDINNIGSGSAPSASSGTPNQPIVINFKTGAATKNSDGSFTLAATTPIPTTATGSGIASLEGRAVVSLPNLPLLGSTATTATQLGVPGTSLNFVITDATPQPRNAIVDIAKCDVCHNTLTEHGQNRTNDINLCASCHNPNATDIVQHTATDTTSPCAPGTPEHSIDFKVMIHEIHASGDSYAYGTSGVTICSFGGSPSVFKVLYPGSSNISLANCAACHNSGTYYPVDPTVIQGTTIQTGDRTVLTDDVVISPNSAVCSSCHTDTDAKNHMTQNGGNFAATKTALGALNPGSAETCGICHNAGGVADVAVMHRLSRFQ